MNATFTDSNLGLYLVVLIHVKKLLLQHDYKITTNVLIVRYLLTFNKQVRFSNTFHQSISDLFVIHCLLFGLFIFMQLPLSALQYSIALCLSVVVYQNLVWFQFFFIQFLFSIVIQEYFILVLKAINHHNHFFKYFSNKKNRPPEFSEILSKFV